MNETTKATDPKPLPPQAPPPDRCCHSGCGEACVEEIYALELRAYRMALQAWEACNPEAA